MSASNTPKEIVIFRPGRHTASGGETLDFSEGKLAAAVAAYDPVLHEAPLCIGHPKDNAPAYGWVQSMGLGAGGAVAVRPHQVNADFAELVNTGAFKKVSASWYLPDAAANPKPGTLYLRHVAFLGAQPPALKGLPSVEFSDNDEGTVTIDFAEVPGWQRASGWRAVTAMLRAFRDMLVEDKGAEKAEAILPSWRIDDLATLAEAEAQAGASDFTEPASNPPNPNPEVPVVKPTHETDPGRQPGDKTADFAEREAAIAIRERELNRKENEAFLNDLVADGRPLPCDKGMLLNFMEALGTGGTAGAAGSSVNGGFATVDFGEAGAKPALEVFKSEIMAKLPKQVDFAERAPGEPGADQASDPTEIARAAVSYQEEMRGKGVVVSTTEAVAHVSKERSQ